LGVVLYLVEFTGFGVGPRTQTEQTPERRPWQKQVSLISVVTTYVLSLAMFFDRLTRRQHAPSPPRR
jgi:hypothetical protein